MPTRTYYAQRVQNIRKLNLDIRKSEGETKYDTSELQVTNIPWYFSSGISSHVTWYTCTNYNVSHLKTLVMFIPPPWETELSLYGRLKNLTKTIRGLRSSGMWRCVTGSRNVRQHSLTDAALNPWRTKTSTAPVRMSKNSHRLDHSYANGNTVRGEWKKTECEN